MVSYNICYSIPDAFQVLVHCPRPRRGGASFRVHFQSRRRHYSRHAMYPSCPIGHRLQSNLLPRLGIRFGVILFRFAASQNDEFAALFIPRHTQFHRNYKVNCYQRSASPSPPGMVVSTVPQDSNATVEPSCWIFMLGNSYHSSSLSLSSAHLPTV